MSRPIEFRVWREEYKCIEYFDLFNAEMYAADGPIMQYTGLKDKNGVKIFEDDIVRNTENNNIGAVWYYSLAGAFCVGGGKMPFTYQTEVIGNLHENPELLEHKCST